MKWNRNNGGFVIAALLMLLAAAGCNNGGENEAIVPDLPELPEIQPETFVPVTDTVIAEAKVDTGRDGVEETLVVRLAEGRMYEETEPGAVMGEVVEGDFRLELYDGSGALLHALELNPVFGGGPLVFEKRRDFTIAFEDYNGDRNLDFSIGQYVSSNEFNYNLFSLIADRIEPLPVVNGELFTAESVYSAKYEKLGSSSFKNRYYDRAKGEVDEAIYTWQEQAFVRTECENCKMLSEAAHSGDIGELAIGYAETENGFQLLHFDQDQAFVNQTWISPEIDGVSYAVHLIRRTYTNGDRTVYRQDAVVVNPATAEFHTYPLYEYTQFDMQEIGSIAKAYGFKHDRHLVFVSANNGNESDTTLYSVKELDILTGEISLILEALPESPTDVRFAPGWLAKDSLTLVLNGYNSGRVWTIDLAEGKLQEPEIRAVHYWPFYMTVVSPGGDRLWVSDYEQSEYRLYDIAGNLLRSMPFTTGFDQYLPFRWSPNGAYSAFHDTYDQNDAHVIGDNGENYIIAPQRIRFFDSLGQQVFEVRREDGTGRYVELAGWLDLSPNLVLLAEYELDQQKEPKEKLEVQYALLDIATGNKQSLRLAHDFSSLRHPVPARSAGQVELAEYWVDSEQALLYMSERPGSWLTKPDASEQIWIDDWFDTEGSLKIYDTRNGTVRVNEITAFHYQPQLLGQNWIVNDEMRYIRYQE